MFRPKYRNLFNNLYISNGALFLPQPQKIFMLDIAIGHPDSIGIDTLFADW